MLFNNKNIHLKWQPCLVKNILLVKRLRWLYNDIHILIEKSALIKAMIYEFLQRADGWCKSVKN